MSPNVLGDSEFTLRDLAWPDIETLVTLERELFAADAWAGSTWWAELAGRPRRDYVLAIDRAGELAGYAGLDHGGDVADVMTIAVTSAARGRGLGAALLAEIEERASSRGAQALLLEVRADNAPAIRFYATAGFDVLATRRRYYQPGDVDAVVMRKLLSGGPEPLSDRSKPLRGGPKPLSGKGDQS